MILLVGEAINHKSEIINLFIYQRNRIKSLMRFPVRLIKPQIKLQLLSR